MFMRNIMLAIARLLGITTKPSDSPAQPTQTVGLANQEHTTKRGNKRSVEPTKPQPAKRKPKPKSSPAKQVTQGKSSKPKSKPAQAERGQKPRKTRVSKA